MFLAGDLNVDNLVEGYHRGLLYDVFGTYDLTIVFAGPTRITEQTSTQLDYLVKDNGLRVMEQGIEPTSMSDHSWLYASIEVGPITKACITIERRNITKQNLDTFLYMISKQDLYTDNKGNTDTLFNEFYSGFIMCLKCASPNCYYR